MKRSVIYHVFFKSVQQIFDAVHGFIEPVNQDPEAIRKRLCFL